MFVFLQTLPYYRTNMPYWLMLTLSCFVILAIANALKLSTPKRWFIDS